MRIIILNLIRFYQKTLSPIFQGIRPHWGCRFYPSCSEYSYQSIEKYGLFKGMTKSLKRIIKCHSLNEGGYDPC